MTSEVEICNIALSKIRGGTINSLTEPSVQAQYCKLLYPTVRDTVLEDSLWGFSRVVKPLATLSSVELFDWVNAYQYPSDCLKINRLRLNFEQFNQDSSSATYRIYDHNFPVPNIDQYKVEYEVYNDPVTNTKVIGANESELRIDYVKKITDPNLFSTKLVKAISCLLGSELAVPIIGVEKGMALENSLLSLYTHYLNSALADNESESQSTNQDSEYITVRN